MTYKKETSFAHVYPIDSATWPKGDCSKIEAMTPVVNCGYDLAGDTLKYLLPNIEMKMDLNITEIKPKD